MNVAARRQAAVAVPSDADLVEACAAGDEDAFRLLYQRHVQRVRSLLVRLSGPTQLDDMTQETFLRVWRNVGSVRKGDGFSAWVYSVAVNVARDTARRESRLLPRFLGAAKEIAGSRNEATSQEAKDLVRGALATLDFKHRTVLVLHDMEQWTEQEIAATLVLPRGTVKSRLHHARAKMRAYVEKTQ